LQTPSTRYGLHYRWGDTVTAEYLYQKFNVRIEAVSVKVDKGRETIETTLRGDELI